MAKISSRNFLTEEEKRKIDLAGSLLQPNKNLETKVPTQVSTEAPKQTSPGLIRDTDTGMPSGIVLPDGRIFQGSPKQTREMAELFAGKLQAPAGTVEQSGVAMQNQAFMQEQQAQLEAQQIQALAPQVGQNQFLPEIPVSQGFGSVDLGQVTRAGLGNIIPSIAGGVALGATGGALAGGALAVPGAIIGGVAGLVTGFVSGAKTEMKQQLTGDITATTNDLKTIQSNMRALITDTNQNPQNAQENLEMFNYQLALAQQQYSKLKRQTQNNLNDYVDVKTRVQLEKFEMFYSIGGNRDRSIQSMQNALLNPNPAKIDLSISDLENEE